MALLQVCHESHGQEAQDQVFCLGQEEGKMLKLVSHQLQLANKHFQTRRGFTALPALVIFYKNMENIKCQFLNSYILHHILTKIMKICIMF